MSVMTIKTADGQIFYAGYDPEYGVPEKETVEYKEEQMLLRQEEARRLEEGSSFIQRRDKDIGI